MAFEGEPRNGDYAAYIDKLVNQGTGTPGEQRLKGPSLALPPGTPRVPREMLAPGEQQYDPGSNVAARPATATPSATHTSPTSQFPTGINQPASGTTLALQGKSTVTGLVQMALGVLFLFLGLGSVVSAFNSPDPFDPGNIIRLVVLLVIARALFKRGAVKLRAAQNTPLSPLPPFVPARRPKQKD